MSNEAEAWAVKQTAGGPAAKAVLMQLARHHNGKTGRCDPTRRTLMLETELSKNTVSAALRTLLARGLIEIQPGHGYVHNWYSFPGIKAQLRPFNTPIKAQPLGVENKIKAQFEQNQSPTAENQSPTTDPPSIYKQERTGNKQEDPRVDTQRINLHKNGSLEDPQAWWIAVLTELVRQVPKRSYDTWLRHCVVLDKTPTSLTLGCGSPTEQHYLTQRFSSLLQRVTQRFEEHPMSVTFVAMNLDARR